MNAHQKAQYDEFGGYQYDLQNHCGAHWCEEATENPIDNYNNNAYVCICLNFQISLSL